MPTTLSIRSCTLKWVRPHLSLLLSKLEVALSVDTSTFALCSRSVLLTITDNDLLLVVSRGSTRCEKIQIAALLPGTMRRISRARSIISGVELWRPAKTTTRKSRCFCALHHHDRMLMPSCHIAFEHRHHLAFACIKLFAEQPLFVF